MSKLSVLSKFGGLVVPPVGFIIVSFKKETDSGIILPHGTGRESDGLGTVVAINPYAQNYNVGDKVVVSFSRYIKSVPGPHDVGKDTVVAFPQERILEDSLYDYYILYEGDILYSVHQEDSSIIVNYESTICK